MKLRFLAPYIMIGAVLLTGCASAQTEQMIIASGDLETYQGDTKLKHSFVVKEVLGGKGTSGTDGALNGNNQFKEALINSLKAAQLLSPNPPGKYNVVAKLVYVDLRSEGLDRTATTTAKYVVVENSTNREIYNEIIRTFHTATMGDAFS